MNKFERLSAFVEVSTGSTPRVESIKKYIDILAPMGYTDLYLGMTDGYKMESEPYFNYKRGGYTVAQLQELDNYAKRRGIELIASIQTLGHLHYLRRHAAYAPLMDTDHVLMVGEEEVYMLIEKMFATMAQGLSSRRIHIGMDEVHGIGSGAYGRKHGFSDPRDLILTHLKRVAAIADKYGYQCEIWSDMLMSGGKSFSSITTEKVRDRLPKNVRIYLWDYDNRNEEILRKKIAECQNSCNDAGYAGAAWRIWSFAPHNHCSIARILPQMKVCCEMGVKEFMITLWSDGGAMLGLYSSLPALFAAAEYAQGYESPRKERFKEITGIDYDILMSLDYLDDPFRTQNAMRGNRSFWLFYGDPFVTSYDLLIREETGAQYGKLAQEYEQHINGAYGSLFKTEATLARVLEIKAGLGKQIRAAYKEKNKDALKALMLLFPILKTRTEEFLAAYEERFYKENIPFGIEVTQTRIGGQFARWAYVEQCIRRYIEKDCLIDELEDVTLLPSVAEDANEDNLCVKPYGVLISGCGGV